MTAVNSTTGDQTTTWVNGTTLADSGVARNDLLRATIYPNTDLSWATLTAGQWASLTAAQWAALRAYPVDTTFVNYNRLGEQTTFTDQRSTVRTFTRDALGRQTDDGVTTVGSNTDSAVLRISRVYEIRGLVSTITSADNATPGSGTILNQVQFTYNDFGQLIEDEQEHGGAVGGSTPSVEYAYDSGGSSSNEIRLNQLTYPNGRTIGYGFGTSGEMSDYLSRVEAINATSSGTTTLAQYLYLGAGMVIRITNPEPGIWLDLWGGTSGTFAGIDQFGRVIDQRWQNNIATTPGDIDRYKYGYDQNSNRLWKANVVGTAAVTAGLDEFYTYDPLNRLTEMQRGVLNGTQTGITGTPSVEQDWTLDPTGNWFNFVSKASGTTDLNQTRTANRVNEITNITESTGPTWIVPSYDDAGNTITMPQPASPTNSYTAIHDAWNRMVSISDAATPVGKYQYDGRNFRTVKKTYTSGTLSETRDFYFTSNWQDIEEQVGASTLDQYVWGIRYIDELVCRDDSTPERVYVTQDANFNLTGISDTSGSVVERYLFNPYGDRTIMNASWGIIGFSGYDWNIGFQGLMIDPESGLMVDRNRIVLSLIGRFLSRDGAGYEFGNSLYEYLLSNPSNTVDATGWGPVGAGRGIGGNYDRRGHGGLPPGIVCGLWVKFYTGSFCNTQAAYDAAVDAAGKWLSCNSPVRGGLFTLAGQTNPTPTEGWNAGKTGNIWGGWTIDEGQIGGVEYSWPVNVSTPSAQGVTGGGLQWQSGGGATPSPYAWVGGSYDGAYFQAGKDGYLELGLGVNFGGGHGNLSGGLLLDYRKLTSAWWNKDENGCPCSTGAASPPPSTATPVRVPPPQLPAFGPGWFGAPHN